MATGHFVLLLFLFLSPFLAEPGLEPEPSEAPPTDPPTAPPTAPPTEPPTPPPTDPPTEPPTEPPPTDQPTTDPTAQPTPQPTADPTAQPTARPTRNPTLAPTEQPTAAPTEQPTSAPTPSPTANPALLGCNSTVYEAYVRNLGLVCRSVCGDGLVTGAEECDLGANNGINLTSLQETGCNVLCRATPGWRCYADSKRAGVCVPVCGDGKVVGKERCDNVTGCSSTCQPRKGYYCKNNRCTPICGDGITTWPEECDQGRDTNTNHSGICQSCRIIPYERPISPAYPQPQPNPPRVDYYCCPEDKDRGRLGDWFDCKFEDDEGRWHYRKDPYYCAGFNFRCGDGIISVNEECDSNPGCGSDCKARPGYTCKGVDLTKPHRACVPVCGDGIYSPPEEQCDPGPNRHNNIGCSSDCKARYGYNCTGNRCAPIAGDRLVVYPELCDGVAGCNTPLGQPLIGYKCIKNVCTPLCGDGTTIPPEECDNTGPGCVFCKIVPGYNCTGNKAAQTCRPICGDGKVIAPEQCDNYNLNGVWFGCNSSTCQPHPGYQCNSTSCSPICGDGLVKPPEQCDLKSNRSKMLTGCHPTSCRAVSGYVCDPGTNTCQPLCGDARVIAPEECDAGRDGRWFGCSNVTCRALPGFACPNNVCWPICGDGLVIGPEECDHGGNRTKMLSGCDAFNCTHSLGFTCPACAMGSQCPNLDCQPLCGDGRVFPPEQCDSVPGCTACRASTGFTCTDNLCTPICGDGLVIPPEQCDHGNNLTRMLNGCEAFTCRWSPGYTCPGNECAPICGDGIVLFPEECDNNTEAGCITQTCRAAKGYRCENNHCLAICGDGLVIGPEECDHGGNRSSHVGCNDACLHDIGYKCDPFFNTCSPICGDGLVIPPEQCDNTRRGCDLTTCTRQPGYTCSTDNLCTPVCGDGIQTVEEECDFGNNDPVNCRSCIVQPGFECHNRTTRRCSKCETRKAHIYNLKDPFPFPSLANYSALLLGTTTFSACSACDSGIQSSYDKVVNNLTCKELPVTIDTSLCSYPCNGYSFTSPLESIAYLKTQLSKDDFLNQIVSAIFGPGYKIVILDNKRADDGTLSFTLDNCNASNANPNQTAAIFQVISGLVSDIIPNASTLTSTYSPADCTLTTKTSDKVPIALIVGIVVGLSVLFLLVGVAVFAGFMVRHYYNHELHNLPPDISWSFLNKLSHPWLWEERKDRNAWYYIRRYGPMSEEYRTVKNSLIAFSGGGFLPIVDIYAIYNPKLVTSFLNQFNVFSSRKKHAPQQYFATNYHTSQQKMWVMEQFERLARQFSWNEDWENVVPIIPALHGSDMLIAEKIAMTGFASLSTLDDGYFGKGIYFTTLLNYSLPYAYNKDNPVVIFSYINMGNIFPVTEDHKGPNTLLGKGLQSGYNSHFVITTAEGEVYAAHKSSVYATVDAHCTEIVVGQESQILPAFVICMDKIKIRTSLSRWSQQIDAAALSNVISGMTDFYDRADATPHATNTNTNTNTSHVALASPIGTDTNGKATETKKHTTSMSWMSSHYTNKIDKSLDVDLDVITSHERSFSQTALDVHLDDDSDRYHLLQDEQR